MKLCSYGNCQEKLQGYGRSLCNEHYKLVNPKASRSYPKLHVVKSRFGQSSRDGRNATWLGLDQDTLHFRESA